MNTTEDKNNASNHDLRRLVGKRVKSLVDFASIPKGTTGKVINLHSIGDKQGITVEWDRKTFNNRSICDGFGRDKKFDETKYLEVLPQYNVEIWDKEKDTFSEAFIFRHNSRYLPKPVKSVEVLREILRLMEVEHYQIYETDEGLFADMGKVIETTPELKAYLDEEDKAQAQKKKEIQDKIDRINQMPKEFVLAEYTDKGKTMQIIATRFDAEQPTRLGNREWALIRTVRRCKGADPDDDESYDLEHRYRSKDGKFLSQKFLKDHEHTTWGKQLHHHIPTLFKVLDDLRKEIEEK